MPNGSSHSGSRRCSRPLSRPLAPARHVVALVRVSVRCSRGRRRNLMVRSTCWFAALRRPARRITPSASHPVTRAKIHANMRAALERLQEQPGRGRVLEVGAALRASIGARDDETCSDILRRGSCNGLERALLCAERAAFVRDRDLVDAIRELVETARDRTSWE